MPWADYGVWILKFALLCALEYPQKNKIPGFGLDISTGRTVQPPPTMIYAMYAEQNAKR